MANDLVAIDISHWQPDPVDFAKVKAAGIIGVIHKATEGTGTVDDKLFSRANKAMQAGLKWSTYHFLRPGSLPQQMDFYLNTIDPVEGERVCLDYEDQGVHIGDLEYCVNYLLSKRPDLQITIYSGHVLKEQLGSHDSPVLAKTSLWLAQYSSTPSWPTQVWPQWTLWQYTDKASVPGITGAVDGDRFNGSRENCAAWFGPASEEPAPGPEPEMRTVKVKLDLETPDDVKIELEVTQNGELIS